MTTVGDDWPGFDVPLVRSDSLWDAEYTPSNAAWSTGTDSPPPTVTVSWCSLKKLPIEDIHQVTILCKCLESSQTLKFLSWMTRLYLVHQSLKHVFLRGRTKHYSFRIVFHGAKLAGCKSRSWIYIYKKIQDKKIICISHKLWLIVLLYLVTRLLESNTFCVHYKAWRTGIISLTAFRNSYYFKLLS